MGRLPPNDEGYLKRELSQSNLPTPGAAKRTSWGGVRGCRREYVAATLWMVPVSHFQYGDEPERGGSEVRRVPEHGAQVAGGGVSVSP